jgi:hypothetical protein
MRRNDTKAELPKAIAASKRPRFFEVAKPEISPKAKRAKRTCAMYRRIVTITQVY